MERVRIPRKGDEGSRARQRSSLQQWIWPRALQLASRLPFPDSQLSRTIPTRRHTGPVQATLFFAELCRWNSGAVAGLLPQISSQFSPLNCAKILTAFLL